MMRPGEVKRFIIICATTGTGMEGRGEVGSPIAGNSICVDDVCLVEGVGLAGLLLVDS